MTIIMQLPTVWGRVGGLSNKVERQVKDRCFLENTEDPSQGAAETTRQERVPVNLSSEPQAHMEAGHNSTSVYNPSTPLCGEGRRDRGHPDVCWPPSIAYTMRTPHPSKVERQGLTPNVLRPLHELYGI